MIFSSLAQLDRVNSALVCFFPSCFVNETSFCRLLHFSGFLHHGLGKHRWVNSVFIALIFQSYVYIFFKGGFELPPDRALNDIFKQSTIDKFFGNHERYSWHGKMHSHFPCLSCNLNVRIQGHTAHKDCFFRPCNGISLCSQNYRRVCSQPLIAHTVASKVVFEHPSEGRKYWNVMHFLEAFSNFFEPPPLQTSLPPPWLCHHPPATTVAAHPFFRVCISIRTLFPAAVTTLILQLHELFLHRWKA